MQAVSDEIINHLQQAAVEDPERETEGEACSKSPTEPIE